MTITGILLLPDLNGEPMDSESLKQPCTLFCVGEQNERRIDKLFLSPSLPSGEESERALQELHLPLSEADRQAQPLLRRQAALCG